MSNIKPLLIPSNGLTADQRKQQQNQTASGVDFDALLVRTNAGLNLGSGIGATGNSGLDNISALGLGDPFNGFIDELIDTITRTVNNQLSANNPLAPKFPFSSAFESTFGLSGPLPNFITKMTAELHLDATQNQAFQDIAIRNKDIVKTPESVRKIGIELEQAGIRYPVKAPAKVSINAEA